MKTFRLTSWIIWGLSIVVAITLAVLHRKDLTLIPNIIMWISLICGNIGNILAANQKLNERIKYLQGLNK